MDEETTSIIEALADLEHEQWIYWSHIVADELQTALSLLEFGTKREVAVHLQTILDRWKKSWTPYDELEEDIKEYDREWARKAWEIVRDGD